MHYPPKYSIHTHARKQTRHVILPKDIAKTLPKSRLLTEVEWRGIGVQQSRGWQHYALHRPEPHVLLFRRPLGTDPQSGRVNPALLHEARKEYKGQLGLPKNIFA
jgi:cyclin-dependent kinase regulatory subunit CKS1